MAKRRVLQKKDGSPNPPRLTPDYPSINAFTGWVAAALAAGVISGNQAREFSQAASVMLRAVRQEHDENILQILEDGVKKLEKIRDEIKQLHARNWGDYSRGHMHHGAPTGPDGIGWQAQDHGPAGSRSDCTPACFPSKKEPT